MSLSQVIALERMAIKMATLRHTRGDELGERMALLLAFEREQTRLQDSKGKMARWAKQGQVKFFGKWQLYVEKRKDERGCVMRMLQRIMNQKIAGAFYKLKVGDGVHHTLSCVCVCVCVCVVRW